MNVRLYFWQRATAAILAPLVVVHSAVIFYAARHGMSAADILTRTQGSVHWAGFYALFVTAASIHAGIGIRNIVGEWLPPLRPQAGRYGAGFAIILFLLGIRAVAAVVLP